MMGGVAPGAGLGGDRVWRSARNTPKMDSVILTSPEKIMSAHMTPEQVRSKIDHPIVDGDGHWVEYDPVFSGKMRKVGGDLAADGFLKTMGTTREALSMSVAERRHKRMGQQAFWARQAENTLDRGTAMMPKLLYDRLTNKTGVHTRLRDYFANIPTPDANKAQSIEDLAPVIELYHHTVRAGRYNDAQELFSERLVDLLYFRFGAYQICIELLRSLFPDAPVFYTFRRTLFVASS